ncbi:ABC transporter permease [Bifidobacterium pseudolongum subsp. globosum]|nr:hypothetical protein [Bifidobacterium pseudolongum]RYQ28713.1 ABC transporter permease [Bifidobacterium pseudolongum subsp. globosum]
MGGTLGIYRIAFPVILADQSNQTIPLAQYVFSSQFATNYPQAFASYLMAMAPVLVVYIFAQNVF